MPASVPNPDPRPARWRPSAFIRASVLLHVAAAALVLLRPHWWPWALAAILANHLIITALGLWPRSHLLGPNWTRLPQARGAGMPGAVAITIDDGPDPEITPLVLALLEKHQARATFFCIGERIERYPQLARAIVAQGHGIENHSFHHATNFSLLGPGGMAEEIRRTQAAITEATGESAQFFRAPAGLRNPFLDIALARTQLRLVSWTRRGFDTVNHSPDKVLNRLTRDLRAGDILLLHDGHAARTASGSPVILEVLPPLLRRLAEAQLEPVTLRTAFARAA